MNKFVKHLIVGKIKGLATQIKQSRQEIYASCRSKKIDCGLPFVKQRLGEEARYQHLAYTFLRGIPYATAENRCGPSNAVKVKRLFDTIQRNIEFGYDHWLNRQSTQENVVKWLAGEVIEMRQKPYVPKTRAQLEEMFPHLKSQPIQKVSSIQKLWDMLWRMI
jgi:hypothetical protein